jgi:hypothetical protein
LATRSNLVSPTIFLGVFISVLSNKFCFRSVCLCLGRTCKYWRMPSSGMWCRIDLVWTDVSEERMTYIFRVEKSASEEPTWAGGSSMPSPAHGSIVKID